MKEGTKKRLAVGLFLLNCVLGAILTFLSSSLILVSGWERLPLFFLVERAYFVNVFGLLFTIPGALLLLILRTWRKNGSGRQAILFACLPIAPPLLLLFSMLLARSFG